METTFFVSSGFGWGLAPGVGAIPKAGNKGAAGSSGATKPSSQRKAPGNCLALQPERARAEQSEQHGRRGAWRRGAERVLVPADSSAVSSTHLRSVFTKLNVLSRTEAITAASRRWLGQV